MKRALRFWLGMAVCSVLAACSDDTRTIHVTPTPVPGEETPTATPSAVDGTPPTAVATDSPTAVTTPSAAATAATASPQATSTLDLGPTPTPAEPAAGPAISYFGVASAEDFPLQSSGTDAAGRPIYQRLFGAGLNLIVEAKRGPDNAPPGISAYDQGGDFPDLQLLVSRPLGDGSAAVCDVDLEGLSGGVPATDPPLFSNPAATADVINDLGCRVNDGTGAARGRTSGQACTRFESGEFAFVSDDSVLQFCLPVARAWDFPQGDTIVTARLRSVRGTLGEPMQIVVRVERELPPISPGPSPTPVESAMPTLTPVPPRLTYLGVASADDRVQAPDGADGAGRPVFERLLGHGFTLIVEGAPEAGGRPVGFNAYDPQGMAPDLQLLVSNDLGDGSEAVCDFDIDEELFGGIPGIDPPAFSSDPKVIDALNDLGCRTNDGTGQPLGRLSTSACTRTEFGDFAVVDASSTVQFCVPIAKAWSFPIGDTVVAARLRSSNGGLSETGEIVIRVREDDTAFQCDGNGLGTRMFSVARPGSGLLVAENESDNSQDPWLADDLQLCAGVDTGDGVHSLRLLDDAILGFKADDDSVVCVKLFAQESGGILDCNGIQGHDVETFQDAVSSQREQSLGLGDPQGPGAATLALRVGLLNLPAGASVESCSAQRFGFSEEMVLTTAKSTGVVTNSGDSEQPILTVEGARFDCAQWTSDDGGPGLVLTLPLLGQPVLGDTVLGLVLQD